MTSSTHDSSLQGLPYDVRLEIFSYMALPPFDGCQDYAGLCMSCRQLYEDVNHEGIRRLRIHVQKIGQSSREVGRGKPFEDTSCDDGQRPSLKFLIPSSIYGRPLIGVNVPFLLPSKDHDWHLQRPPQKRCGTGRKFMETPGPGGDAFYAVREKRRDRTKQEEIYRARVEEMLGSIGDLHSLRARIEIRIVADEHVISTISKDSTYSLPLEHHWRLPSVVLGKILEVYFVLIRNQSFERMQQLLETGTFLTTALEIAWDFESGDPTKRQAHNPWLPTGCSRLANYSQAQVVYTSDRREGFLQMRFDVKGYLRLELENIRWRISVIKGNLEGQDAHVEVDVDGQREALARDVEKLRKLSNPRLWGVKSRWSM